jgi:hypothetical protein
VTTNSSGKQVYEKTLGLKLLKKLTIWTISYMKLPHFRKHSTAEMQPPLFTVNWNQSLIENTDNQNTDLVLWANFIRQVVKNKHTTHKVNYIWL